MVQINFNDKEQFARLERLAYDGTLDYTDYPAAEYKYFDRLAELGRLHRGSKLPAGLCKERKEIYFSEYGKDVSERFKGLEAEKRFQENIIKSDELRCKIYKTDSPEEKLKLALKCIELMTGEEGFMERNTRKKRRAATEVCLFCGQEILPRGGKEL